MSLTTQIIYVACLFGFLYMLTIAIEKTVKKYRNWADKASERAVDKLLSQAREINPNYYHKAIKEEYLNGIR